jgi:hypothetical protein
VQLNGENTKYFQARATERYMHNNIAGIHSVDEVFLEDHQQKAAAFLHCFKQRMGVSFPSTETLDIQGCTASG